MKIEPRIFCLAECMDGIVLWALVREFADNNDKVKGGPAPRKTVKNRVLDTRPIGGVYGVLKAIRYRYSSEYRQIERESPI